MTEKFNDIAETLGVCLKGLVLCGMEGLSVLFSRSSVDYVIFSMVRC